MITPYTYVNLYKHIFYSQKVRVSKTKMSPKCANKLLAHVGSSQTIFLTSSVAFYNCFYYSLCQKYHYLFINVVWLLLSIDRLPIQFKDHTAKWYNRQVIVICKWLNNNDRNITELLLKGFSEKPKMLREQDIMLFFQDCTNFDFDGWG